MIDYIRFRYTDTITDPANPKNVTKPVYLLWDGVSGYVFLLHLKNTYSFPYLRCLGDTSTFPKT